MEHKFIDLKLGLSAHSLWGDLFDALSIKYKSMDASHFYFVCSCSQGHSILIEIHKKNFRIGCFGCGKFKNKEWVESVAALSNKLPAQIYEIGNDILAKKLEVIKKQNAEFEKRQRAMGIYKNNVGEVTGVASEVAPVKRNRSKSKKKQADGEFQIVN